MRATDMDFRERTQARRVGERPSAYQITFPEERSLVCPDDVPVHGHPYPGDSEFTIFLLRRAHDRSTHA